MKLVWKIYIIIGLIGLFTGKEVIAENSLQSKIDSIPENGTFKIKKGIYQERIVLKKSIVLDGEKGAIFKACSLEPVITIKGKNIKIKGISIDSCKKNTGGDPVIYVTGKNHLLEDLSIHSGRTAVKLENANYITVKNLKVTGKEQERGIDLWAANFNTFNGIKMDHVQDGFYMENSHYNTFSGNKISDSRYGLHVMFSDNIKIKNNISIRNFTGAMIMGTNHSLIENNQFKDNNQNVNAQGLLLYDVHQSIIRENLISNNRVGMYLEDSTENTLIRNNIISNFIGTQITNISKNKVIGNSFISNVNEIQALKGTDNLIRDNYWDAASKLDTTGDGKSNLPYRADPYFLNLIGETPEFQLFFQDPGMLLLQKMLKSPDQKLVKDESPLMNSELHINSHADSDQTGTWILSLIMIMGSLLMIVKGRKGF